jgi:hypothetical protein
MNIAETPTIAKPMLADGACNLLAKPLHESTIERMNNWLKSNADGFTNKNEKYKNLSITAVNMASYGIVCRQRHLFL